jgi:hypothetical protein
MNIDTDKQFQTMTIESVEERPDGWDVKWADHWGMLYVTNETCKRAPVPGEVARCYGKGGGYVVRGIVINGRVYRYKTEAALEQEHQDYLAAEQRRKLEALERERPQRDRDIAILPEPLRKRIERFQQTLGGWRAEFEPYELFACQEAFLIAEALKTGDAIRAFRGLPHEEQRAQVPGLSQDHSGNTFGVACRLAQLLVERPDLAAKEHGALCPLVGCVDYGCWAAHEGKAS